MCRHIAYIGPSATLSSVLIDPPTGLYRQSWAPRMQRHGTVNADGFGVGWYTGGDQVPARYRRAVPIWGDSSLPDIARVTRSGAILAAVRSATPGMALGEAAAAPFAADRWLFSHNGVLDGWPYSAAKADPDPVTLLSLEAMTDSAFLWALALARLRDGATMTAALAQAIAHVEATGAGGRFNFLLTDGQSIAATACGDTLWYRCADGAVTVASEPSDESPGWTEVPDRHALAGSPAGVAVIPLASALAASQFEGRAGLPAVHAASATTPAQVTPAQTTTA
jgi:glutamine amidotransferase